MELSSFNNSFKTATRTRFQTITFIELHALLNTEVSFLEKKSNSKESIVISSFAIVENFDNHNQQCERGHNSRSGNNGRN